MANRLLDVAVLNAAPHRALPRLIDMQVGDIGVIESVERAEQHSMIGEIVLRHFNGWCLLHDPSRGWYTTATPPPHGVRILTTGDIVTIRVS